MYLDFHTHGKLAKYLPFSKEYTNWLLGEAKKSGLDGICLTEHFNTQQFKEVYQYIYDISEKEGDSLNVNGLKIFPGMETDIAEGGHILCIGPMEVILELNEKLEPYKEKGHFLSFKQLIELYSEYPVLIGAGHPFREGGNIPCLSDDLLKKLNFIDLNGKDIALNQEKTRKLTYEFSEKLGIPVIAGSDTHQAVQYGCIRTNFDNDFSTFKELKEELEKKRFTIDIHPEAEFKVKTATLLKKCLKQIHALGGDYVEVLIGTTEVYR